MGKTTADPDKAQGQKDDPNPAHQYSVVGTQGVGTQDGDRIRAALEASRVAFDAEVDKVAAAAKKLIDAGVGGAVAAETALKMWLQHVAG